MAQTEISAGGVIYRQRSDGIFEVCLITGRGKKRWQLPKGWVEPGETHEQAALREVREETGLVGEIESPLESIDFWYVSKFEARPERRHKYVHHFLLRYVSGDTGDHDHEVDDARWFLLDDAPAALSFPNERSVMARAAQILASRRKKAG